MSKSTTEAFIAITTPLIQRNEKYFFTELIFLSKLFKFGEHKLGT